MCGGHSYHKFIAAETIPAVREFPQQVAAPVIAGLDCPNCGARVAPDFTWCPKCGSALKSHPCAYCGQPLAPTDTTCPNCGAPSHH